MRGCWMTQVINGKVRPHSHSPSSAEVKPHNAAQRIRMASDDPGPGQKYAIMARKHIAALRVKEPWLTSGPNSPLTSQMPTEWMAHFQTRAAGAARRFHYNRRREDGTDCHAGGVLWEWCYSSGSISNLVRLYKRISLARTSPHFSSDTQSTPLQLQPHLWKWVKFVICTKKGVLKDIIQGETMLQIWNDLRGALLRRVFKSYTDAEVKEITAVSASTQSNRPILIKV